MEWTPDKILTIEEVRLNLGYSFTDPIADRPLEAEKRKSYNISIGVVTDFAKKT